MRFLQLLLCVASAAALRPLKPVARLPKQKQQQPLATAAVSAAVALALAGGAATGVAPPALATPANEFGSEVFTANKGGRILNLDVDVNKVVSLAKTKQVQNEVLDVAKALNPALNPTLNPTPRKHN